MKRVITILLEKDLKNLIKSFSKILTTRCILFFISFIFTGLYAWEINGTPICDAILEQSVPSIVSDDKGGAIIMWDDARNVSTNDFDIFVQKVDKDGNILWTPNGVNICANSSFQYPNPGNSLVPDGNGGAIAIWTDFRNWNFDIYAQRVDSNGVALWTPDGIAVCTATGNQVYAVAVSDDAGGVIVAWYDRRSGESIYAQRISPNGNCLWTTNGVQIAAPPAVTVFEDVYRPLGLVRDGFGGAIIAWKDERAGSSLNPDVYAQRIDYNGNVLWTPSGVPVCTDTANQMNVAITGTGNGNAIIVWADKRDGGYDIWAQRIGADGNLQWTPDGISVCDNDFQNMIPKIIDDGEGGAIIVWIYTIISTEYQYLYAQRVDSSGNSLWEPNGILVCNTADPCQARHSIISDGAGGAIVALSVSLWSPVTWDIYAQRIDPTGDLLWGEGGYSISVIPGSHQMNPSLSLNEFENAIIVWFDQRNDVGDIYAQSSVYAGIEEIQNREASSKAILSIYPNPCYGSAKVRFYLPDNVNATLKIYDATGKLCSTVANGNFRSGWNEITIENEIRSLATGIYFLKLAAGPVGKAGSNSAVKKIILLR